MAGGIRFPARDMRRLRRCAESGERCCPFWRRRCGAARCVRHVRGGGLLAGGAGSTGEQVSAPIGEAVRVNVGFKYGRIGYIVGRYADGNLVVEVDGRRFEYAPSEVLSSISNNGD